MIEVLGWISTALVLIGFMTNAAGRPTSAMILWIIGDIGWIIYDIKIQNTSHMVLSLVIIAINFYGIYRLWKSSSDKTKSVNE